MLKWICVVAILFAAPVYAEFREEHHRAGDWEFGYYEGEGGTPTPSGSTKELSGKGAPLMLERCLAGGSVLTFAIDTEGEILGGSQNYWPAPGSADTELGVLMEPEVCHGETEVYTGVQA